MSDDARAALRRYLEQRRDLGESELVLDRMGVDEALRLLGARTGRAVPRADEIAAPADHPRLVETGATPPVGDVVGEPLAEATDMPHGADWRSALRAADAAPAHASPTPPPTGAPPAPERATGGPDARPPAEPAADAPRAAPRTRNDDDRWVIPGVTEPTGLIVGDESAMPASTLETLETLDSLDALSRIVAECTRCALYRTATRAVPGEGNPNAELVVVGEGPGADEDASGRPFVGASGQLLTKILAAISLSREEVFICNVVKHRPPGNRNPEPDEVQACSPYLLRQLELVRPKVVLTVGNFAAQTLLGTKLGVSKLRGQVHRFHGTPLVATYHPAALLRNPTWKRDTWADVKLVRRILDRDR